MSTLLRKAQKLALGLPIHMATLNLERLGVTNTLEDLIEAHQAAQLTRLRSTPRGRNLLSSLGYPPSTSVLTSTGLSPAARVKLTVSPIPRHMHPTRHTARRDHRSRYLRREYPVGCSAVRVLFTDASPADERGGVTVVVDSDLVTAVCWRQLQTNTFPTPLFYSYLYPSRWSSSMPALRLTAPPYCIWSGFAKTFPTSLPFPNPTLTSWESGCRRDGDWASHGWSRPVPSRWLLHYGATGLRAPPSRHI
ncbi:hypothetical protein HPB49_025453 [Dermacentor silvarum]|uniref:Uncharacterized protein n=1 Tax=Dermacentor silvarum TaxID=543639 RepID=A0ACB8C6I2_DERSI|nr:hypothetical protein HPB49_025453 [Dermacentor silvarum]